MQMYEDYIDVVLISVIFYHFVIHLSVAHNLWK